VYKKKKNGKQLLGGKQTKTLIASNYAQKPKKPKGGGRGKMGGKSRFWRGESSAIVGIKAKGRRKVRGGECRLIRHGDCENTGKRTLSDRGNTAGPKEVGDEFRQEIHARVAAPRLRRQVKDSGVVSPRNECKIYACKAGLHGPENSQKGKRGGRKNRRRRSGKKENHPGRSKINEQDRTNS